MPPLIVDQPWPPGAGEDLRHPDGRPVVCPTAGCVLRAHHDQLFVWATLAPGTQPPSAGATLFPVLIDTGFNEMFLMQQRQAEAWLTAPVFATFQALRNRLKVGAEFLTAWDISLWVYPNVPGTRVPDPSATPVWVDAPHGVWLAPPGSGLTREKPLLGLRAVRFNRLKLRVDGDAGRFALDAP